MATASNGDPGRPFSGPGVPRRVRRDRRPGAGGAEPEVSGRRFVLAALVALAAIWGGLYLAFRDWRARHDALAEFGRTRVATTVDPLAGLSPPGVPRSEWRRAVDDTRRMIAAVAASGLLDRPALEALRVDLSSRVAAARPETAVAVLARLWDDMGRRTRLDAARNPRPRLLGAPGPR